MKCEFDYCVYNKDWVCILDEIRINAIGMCDACEVVTLSKELLEECKKKRLKEIASFAWEKDELPLADEVLSQEQHRDL